MKCICMLLNGPLKYDQRVIRSIDTLSEQNKVDLFYINGDSLDIQVFRGNQNVRLFYFNHQPTFVVKLIRNSFFYLEFDFFIKEVLSKKIQYNVVYANDLPTLHPAFVLGRKLNAKIIYDSHEIYLKTINQFFPTEVNIFKKVIFKFLCWFMRTMGFNAEKSMISGVDALITVNQSLADYFNKQYNIKNITVIKNCPLYNIEKVKPVVDFRKMFSWGDSDKIFLFQGTMNKGRGFELLLEAMRITNNKIKLVMLGFGYIKEQLKRLVGNFRLEERVKFLDRVLPEVLPGYTSAADFGVDLAEDLNLSKKLALSNKLFEYIHVGIPVLCSDTIENKRIFAEFKIGILTENNVDKIAGNMLKLVNSQELSYFKQQCELAAKKYNWQNQAVELNNIVNSL